MRELTEKEWAKVDNLVDKLECSIDEAIDILDADKAIDRNQKVDFDLSPEEHKQAMKLANVKEHTVKKSNVYRPRKPNEIKSAIIAGLSKYLTENADFEVIDEEITNKERTIMFTITAFLFPFVISFALRQKNFRQKGCDIPNL